MDTVADTQKEKEEGKGHKLTSRKKRLKLHVLREAKAMRASRNAYYEQKTLFDYALEDAGLLQGFFSRLDDFRLFRLEKVMTACTYFIVHSDCDMEVKENLCEELNELQSFRIGLANFQNLIAEKAFYYSELWDKLEEIAEYRSAN